MFAIIETNGANVIAIHVPHEGAEKSLPALAAMLEQNATFINKGWQEIKTVKPTMTIQLGDVYEIDGDKCEIKIAPSGAVINDSFTIASPDVFTSNAKYAAKKEKDISDLRSELQFVKQQLERANEQIKALTEIDSGE